MDSDEQQHIDVADGICFSILYTTANDLPIFNIFLACMEALFVIVYFHTIWAEHEKRSRKLHFARFSTVTQLSQSLSNCFCPLPEALRAHGQMLPQYYSHFAVVVVLEIVYLLGLLFAGDLTVASKWFWVLLKACFSLVQFTFPFLLLLEHTVRAQRNTDELPLFPAGLVQLAHGIALVLAAVTVIPEIALLATYSEFYPQALIVYGTVSDSNLFSMLDAEGKISLKFWLCRDVFLFLLYLGLMFLPVPQPLTTSKNFIGWCIGECLVCFLCVIGDALALSATDTHQNACLCFLGVGYLIDLDFFLPRLLITLISSSGTVLMREEFETRAQKIELDNFMKTGKVTRAGNTLDFSGRLVREQRFAVVSFPGRYEKAWLEMTDGEAERLNTHTEDPTQLISTTCVFYPDGNDGLFGLHSVDCHCSRLYSHLPDFQTWPGRRAPWGCMWFEQWKTNTKGALGLKQIPVVVYFEAMAGDNEHGLGNSQKGEVEWLVQKDVPFVAWDITQFSQHASRFAHAHGRPEERVRFFESPYVRLLQSQSQSQSSQSSQSQGMNSEQGPSSSSSISSADSSFDYVDNMGIDDDTDLTKSWQPSSKRFSGLRSHTATGREGENSVVNTRGLRGLLQRLANR